MRVVFRDEYMLNKRNERDLPRSGEGVRGRGKLGPDYYFLNKVLLIFVERE